MAGDLAHVQRESKNSLVPRHQPTKPPTVLLFFCILFYFYSTFKHTSLISSVSMYQINETLNVFRQRITVILNIVLCQYHLSVCH